MALASAPCGCVDGWLQGAEEHVTRHTTQVARHTSHITHHTSHITRHTSHVTRHLRINIRKPLVNTCEFCTGGVAGIGLGQCHMSSNCMIICHMFTMITCHMFTMVTCHIFTQSSHVTYLHYHHTSHITRHTSHVTLTCSVRSN